MINVKIYMIWILVILTASCNVANLNIAQKNEAASAGKKFNLSGIVRDGAGVSLSGVCVELSGAGSGEIYTDGSGKYEFKNLKSGVYIVKLKNMNKLYYPSYSYDEIQLKSSITDFDFVCLTYNSVYSGYDGNNVPIYRIQGEGHYSVYADCEVNNVIGIVIDSKSTSYSTSITGKSQYIKEVFIQSPYSDGNIKSSDGVKLVTSDDAPFVRGDLICIKKGIVEESKKNKSAGDSYYDDNLTRTQIKAYYTSDINYTEVFLVKSGLPLPPPVKVGASGRQVPSGAFASSGFSEYSPDVYSLDFWESVEGMYVSIENPMVTGPTSNVVYSDDYAIKEIYIVADNGDNSRYRTSSGGLRIGEDYQTFNPQILTVAKFNTSLPDLTSGDKLNANLNGVVDYSYQKYKLLPVGTFPGVSDGKFTPERLKNKRSENILSVASFNIENFTQTSARNGDKTEKKKNGIASIIVNNLYLPDIIGLIEVQDDSGSDDDGIVSCDEVIKELIAGIAARTGNPSQYDYRYINPVDGTEGGEPVGNIRVVFLFNPQRVTFVDRPDRGSSVYNADFIKSLSVTETSVLSDNGKPILSLSPGRIGTQSNNFYSTRKSLAGEFLFKGNKVFIIANHFNAKGGDDPLQGRVQPPINGSESKRIEQCKIVNSFVESILNVDKDANVIVLGDFNDFHFSKSLKVFKNLHNVVYDVPEMDRYSYNYEGNAQILDNVLISSNLQSKSYEADIVHTNSELPFSQQSSDHDPVVFSVNFGNSPDTTGVPVLDAGYPVAVANPRSVIMNSKISSGGYIYIVSKSAGSETPKYDEILSGKDYYGNVFNRSVTFLPAGVEKAAVLGNLQKNTQYDIYYMLENRFGIYNSQVNKVALTTTNGSDGDFAAAFTNSDMESDMHNTAYSLKPTGTTYEDGSGIDNSRALHIFGRDDTANVYIFTAAANLNPKGTKSKICFYVKGTCAQKGLVVQIGATGDKQIFNTGHVNGQASLSMSASASYTGSINCSDWTKIILDISTITNPENFTFSIKAGKEADYDLYIDNIGYED